MNESEAEAAVGEILQFLTLSAAVPPKVAALEYFLGLSTTPEGTSLILSAKDGAVISSILILTFADKAVPVVENCLKILINLTVDDDVSWALLNLPNHVDLPKRLLQVVLDRKHVFADQVCGILCNVTRSIRGSTRMAEVIMKESATASDAASEEEVSMHNLVLALTTDKYNEFANLHFLAPFLSNLTQVKAIRTYVMDEKRCVIQRLLPFLNYEKSLERRGGVIGILRNCCFDVEKHEWLLSDDVDLLPRLLLPLAGPEEFDEEDNEKLPDDLQYLPEDKEREPDPDLRKMLVETVFKLCTSKKCREYVRGKNTYVIVRELHKWEKDREVDLAIQKLVDLLIGDDDGKDLDHVEISEEMKATLEKQDQDDEKWVREGDEEETMMDPLI